MGYDLYSQTDKSDAGYFRLNIWGMGHMRDVILQGDPSLQSVVDGKLSSNDGFIVEKEEGKKIAVALRTYLVDNPVGVVPKRIDRTAGFEKAVFAAIATGAFGTAISPNKDVMGTPLTQDWADIIEEFAVYNETKAPYAVL